MLNSLSFSSPHSLRRIAIVGAGSIGLYYGIKLNEAGCDVHFLMRSGFEEARASGIRLRTPSGETHLKHPQVFLRAEDIGPVDCVLVCMKATSNSILEKVLPLLVSSHTAVITLQNGLGNEEFLNRFVPSRQILGALCFVCHTRSTPTVVHCTGNGGISIGEFSEKILTPRVETLVALLQKTGVKAKGVVNLLEERWRKLVWNIPFNGLSVSEEGGITVDRILSTPHLLTKCKDLMEETILAANTLGFPIEAEYANIQLERTYPMGAYRPSTLIDFQSGRKFEVEAIWGIPLRRAQSAGLKMPHLSHLYERLYKLNADL